MQGTNRFRIFVPEKQNALQISGAKWPQGLSKCPSEAVFTSLPSAFASQVYTSSLVNANPTVTTDHIQTVLQAAGDRVGYVEGDLVSVVTQGVRRGQNLAKDCMRDLGF